MLRSEALALEIAVLFEGIDSFNLQGRKRRQQVLQ
jgi:hypothetical protein